jgi:hypothetical protein
MQYDRYISASQIANHVFCQRAHIWRESMHQLKRRLNGRPAHSGMKLMLDRSPRRVNRERSPESSRLCSC